MLFRLFHSLTSRPSSRKRRSRSYANWNRVEVCEERIVLAPSLSLPTTAVDVAEDKESGDDIVTFTFSDADWVYISAGDDSGAFQLDYSLGSATLKVYSPEAIDYESLPPSVPADPSSDRLITLTITAEDITTFESAEGTLTLKILDVAEAPTFGTPPPGGFTFTISEVALTGDSVGTVPVSDPQGDYVSLTVFEGDISDPTTWEQSSTFFAYDDGLGGAVIEVNDGMLLDYETTPTYDLILEASDMTESDTVAVTVNVTDEHDWDDVMGPGIYVADRRVFNIPISPHHSAVVIIPTDQAAWENHPSFTNTIYIGKTEYHYATLSAKPSAGKLESLLNWSDDDPANLDVLELLSHGSTPENTVIQTFLDRDAAYADNLNYGLRPENTPEVDYNSNSYVSGLLEAVGMLTELTYSTDGSLRPGWDTPVEPFFFGIGT
jgi:hypothetical protein